MIIDCGSGSVLVIANVNDFVAQYTINSVSYSLAPNSMTTVSCSGQTDAWLSQVIYTLVSNISSFEIIFQNALLGLAGVLCGGMFIYAVLKNS